MEVAQVVVAALQIVAGVAPGLLAMATGSESDEEAIEKMQSTVKLMPKRTGEGGKWSEDLARRKGDADDA